MRRSVSLTGLCLCLISTFATAQQPHATAVPTIRQDVKEIETEVKKFVDAFNAHDAKAVAKLFTENARIADNTGSTRGRDAIQGRFTAYFLANPKSKIVVNSEEIIFVSPDVAIEEGRAIVSPAETGSEPETSRYTAVYVRQGGTWYQSSLREFEGDEPAIPERLKDLEWLVGDWVNESHEAMVTTSCNWTPDKHYLIRDFTIKIQGRPALTGTQRIGWDPVAKQIRSWVFDSQGGFGEGYWSRVGETWMIKATGVRKDGQTSSATQLITRVGRDHLKWTSMDRTTGGKLAPDADEYTLVRQPPKPSTGK